MSKVVLPLGKGSGETQGRATHQAYEPATGVWNDSQSGDYLWTSTNFGEAFPDVMTPYTWSIVQGYMASVMPGGGSLPYPMIGNIAGRLYMNASVGLSAMAALGLPVERGLRRGSETFGRFADQVEVPILPMSRWWALRYWVPMMVRMWWLLFWRRRGVPAFVAEGPALVEVLTGAIRAASTPEALLSLCEERLLPTLDRGYQMLYAGLSEYRTLSRQLHTAFAAVVGEADANALLSGVSTETDHLASLGLLMGLVAVRCGKMSREAYLQRYGHRGVHEMELAMPRPAGDPGWIDRQLARFERDEVDVAAMLAAQRQRHEAAWARLQALVPRKAKAYRRKLDRLAVASRIREASRSEAVRLLGVFRTYALRAGELTGLGEDVFFLSLQEVGEVLRGNGGPCQFIPARKENHARLAALPPYPPVIRGRFDPFAWAADPNRRSDLYDAHASQRVPIRDAGAITGFPGAAGVVEGIVRQLDGPEEGDCLRQGEVLVATTTNVGWTPLFPRAAAIVTDVGAPLSHAAIVARELGIPAVVGCGDATMRLHTGDRVRVDGGHGVVEILVHAEGAYEGPE